MIAIRRFITCSVNIESRCRIYDSYTECFDIDIWDDVFAFLNDLMDKLGIGAHKPISSPQHPSIVNHPKISKYRKKQNEYYEKIKVQRKGDAIIFNSKTVNVNKSLV
jgi:hypothetical protein